MNSKKKRSSQNLLLISGSSLAILAAVGIGYLIGMIISCLIGLGMVLTSSDEEYKAAWSVEKADAGAPAVVEEEV